MISIDNTVRVTGRGSYIRVVMLVFPCANVSDTGLIDIRSPVVTRFTTRAIRGAIQIEAIPIRRIPSPIVVENSVHITREGIKVCCR